MLPVTWMSKSFLTPLQVQVRGRGGGGGLCQSIQDGIPAVLACLRQALSWAEQSWHAQAWITVHFTPATRAGMCWLFGPRAGGGGGCGGCISSLRWGLSCFLGHMPLSAWRRQEAKNTAETWAAANSQQLLTLFSELETTPGCSVAWSGIWGGTCEKRHLHILSDRPACCVCVFVCVS